MQWENDTCIWNILRWFERNGKSCRRLRGSVLCCLKRVVVVGYRGACSIAWGAREKGLRGSVEETRSKWKRKFERDECSLKKSRVIAWGRGESFYRGNEEQGREILTPYILHFFTVIPCFLLIFGCLFWRLNVLSLFPIYVYLVSVSLVCIAC